MKAIYLYTKKPTPIDFFMPIVQEKARSLGWGKVEIFSDGWDEPQDWNMLVDYANSKRLTHVLLLNAERWHGKAEIAKKDFKNLLDRGVKILLCQGFLPEIHNQHTLSRFLDMIHAYSYYSDVMSLKTREGMQHSKGGRLPFGLQWEGGVKVADENYPTVQMVMGMYEREVPIPEIAITIGLKQPKVRSIVRAWKDTFKKQKY